MSFDRPLGRNVRLLLILVLTIMDIGPHFRPDIGMYFGVILKVIIKYNIKLISFYDIIFCE